MPTKAKTKKFKSVAKAKKAPAKKKVAKKSAAKKRKAAPKVAVKIPRAVSMRPCCCC
jgi:hypothetical protein